jgi:hypothetical protein
MDEKKQEQKYKFILLPKTTMITSQNFHILEVDYNGLTYLFDLEEFQDQKVKLALRENNNLKELMLSQIKN